MTLHVNVSGTWKEVPSPKVNVAGTWKQVTDGYVNVAGTWKRFFQFFTPALSGFVIGDVNVVPAASLQLNTDGTVTLVGNGSVAPSSWGTPTTTGIGASYWCRLTKNSGTDPISGTLATWLQLNSVRAWHWQTNGGNFTLEIATDSGGSNVVASVTGDVTLVAV